MRRFLTTVTLCLLACAIGAGLALWLMRQREPKLPDPPALVEKVREVTRLETLDVSLYKKVSFEPDPQPAKTLLGDALTWAKFTLRPPRGKAIVFADVHFGYDISKLDVASVWIEGRHVEVKLPPLQVKVELKPAETEVMGSNLDSEQTAQLFAVAKESFEREAGQDLKLRERARISAERSIRVLLLGLGFREVVFVDVLPLRVRPG